MTSAAAFVHERFVHTRRTRRLAERIAGFLPAGASVLDIGCGDGLLAATIARARADVTFNGIDILPRPATAIPVTSFDGATIPFAEGSFNAVIMADVLHHASDPAGLLGEACRVARDLLVVKDHTKRGFLAGPTLRFMDWYGNARHGVALPYNYWTHEQWHENFARLKLEVMAFETNLKIYPIPARWLFDRSLHFLTLLRKAKV